MFGAIYIGLSGLTAYSSGLKAVSNNVSNLNTTGFKSANVSFSDITGTGSNGGLEYGYGFGGGGHGVGLNSATINFAQGELRQTDRDLDLAIDGNGFFVLQDGNQTYYARTGSFSVNDEGFIVLNGTNYRLAVLDDSGRPVSLNIDNSRTNAPVATDKISFADNLSSTATSYKLSDIKVYNASGAESVWTVDFTRAEAVPNVWSVKVTNAAGTVIGTKELKFANGLVDPTTANLLFEDAAQGLSVTFDFSANVRSFSSGSVSTLRAAKVAGHATGTIARLAVNQDGELEITYSNDEKKELGAIAIADFRDPQRLEQRSNGLFVSDDYGQQQLLAASDTRVGSILSRRIEASNVDLSGQFGDLILIQRGFQASSQIISASNDMIQQLFGIRGQG
jgi:flagellar hook protein FlgE